LPSPQKPHTKKKPQQKIRIKDKLKNYCCPKSSMRPSLMALRPKAKPIFVFTL